MSGFGLSVDGCPYLFTSGGITTLPTPDAADTSDWSTAWTVAPGFLDWSKGFSWTERMKPLAGDLEWSGLTFTLHDAPLGSIPRLLSYLATRVPRAITQCRITAVTGTGTGALTVDDGSDFPSGAQTIWLEGEAIYCSGRVGNTFTMASRGYYGTVARSHSPKANNQGAPTVWSAFPWITRRRLILWLVSDAGVATAQWRGYAMRAPRLSSDGARFELQANSLWDVEKNLSFIEDTYSTRLAGFNALPVGVYVLTSANSNGGAPSNRGIVETIAFRRAADLCAYLSANPGTGSAGAIRPSILATNPGVTVNQAELAIAGDDLELRTSISGGGTIMASLTLGVPGIGRTDQYSTQTSDPRTAVVRVPLPPAIVIGSETTALPIPVDSVAALPTSFASESYADGSYRTTIAQVLRGDLNDDIALELRPTSASATDPTLIEAQPAVVSKMRLVGKTPQGKLAAARQQFVGDPRGYAWGNYVYVLTDLEVRYALQVEGGHWAYALKHVLQSGSLAKTGVDARNWDWTRIDDLVAATVGSTARAQWSFTGQQQVGPLVVNRAALFGCGLGVRGSRLTVIPFRRALAGETPVASFTRADLVATARPTYAAFPDGLANSVRLKTEDVELNVRYVDSVAKYGQTRTIDLDVSGIKMPSGLDSTYESYVNLVMPRILYLWGEPVQTVEIPVSLAWLDTVFLGDVVAVTEDTLPDGAGGRGLGNAESLAVLGATRQYGFVIGRRVEMRPGSDGLIWLELLIQPVGAGYAPCMRVNTASVTSTTVAANVSFISNASGVGHYAGLSTENDGGAAYFKANDVVEFIQRDTTTLSKLGPYTILSVSGTTITFTASLPGPTVTALSVAGSQWDLRYANYGNGAALQATQETYAFVASNTSYKIGTSTDRALNWSP